MDFYRDIRYLDYEDGENQVENVGSAKIFFRNNTGKVEIYIKKIPCLYPIECKLVVSQNGKAFYTRWMEIDKIDWQKSFEFSWRESYESVLIELIMENGRKICEKKKAVQVKNKPEIKMQQISRDEIESVSVSEDRKDIKCEDVEKNSESKHMWKAIDKERSRVRILGDNEYYMSRISELGELSAELEPLEHNSFLLHGYFNYRHLLIKKDGDKFLVGVPGNYYYREEMVAAMFGFPNFVPAKPEERNFENEEYEKTVGEFGYYFA